MASCFWRRVFLAWFGKYGSLVDHRKYWVSEEASWEDILANTGRSSRFPLLGGGLLCGRKNTSRDVSISDPFYRSTFGRLCIGNPRSIRLLCSEYITAMMAKNGKGNCKYSEGRSFVGEYGSTASDECDMGSNIKRAYRFLGSWFPLQEQSDVAISIGCVYWRKDATFLGRRFLMPYPAPTKTSVHLAKPSHGKSICQFLQIRIAVYWARGYFPPDFDQNFPPLARIEGFYHWVPSKCEHE